MATSRKSSGRNTGLLLATRSYAISLLLVFLSALAVSESWQNLYQQQQQPQAQQQQQQADSGGSYYMPAAPVTLLNSIDELQKAALAQQQLAQQQVASEQLAPPQARPNYTVNIREWTRRLSEEVRLVSERTSCTRKIGQLFESEGKFYQIDAQRLRDSILNQTNGLLAQHKAAVSAIVAEAEKAAMAHVFVKNLTVNYTDVHRVRNELEALSAPGGSGYNFYFFNNNNLQEYPNDYTTNQYGPSSSSGTGDKPQFTSISGGTPVPGPVEWQTPVRSIVMRVNENFGDIPVNTTMSAVHLPLPIYPGLPEIMNAIAWTERLDATFRRNLQQFKHVHHQYYGDTSGIMRTFPAHKWRIARNEPDLFDARTRPWYIAGAATPKDVVILVDTSGSMTGLRREIAKGVVFEILDTLTINDHFSVLRFSESVTPVGLPKCNLRTPHFGAQLRDQCGARAHTPTHQASLASASQQQQQQAAGGPPSQLECSAWRRQWDSRGQYLRDHPGQVLGKNATYMTDDEYGQSLANVTLDIRDAYLLPATSRNVRYLKSNFSMPTAGIANFTRALMAGFELLQAYNRTNDQGSQCNQAIMLISDGSQSSHLELFNRYNYPGAPVRVFTYMIGREVGDIRPLKGMACANRGYYTHVINLSEVREQVQKYLPVMARPLVLAQQHPVAWTNAYGDETHQVLTDWVLEIKRRERARIMLNEERERLSEANSSDVINIELTEIAEYDELALVDDALKSRIICEDSGEQMGNMSADAILSLQDEIDPLGYKDSACHWTRRRADLLTSVVKPVFEQRNTSIFFERVLHKNIWQEREIRVRNAALLGVASVDLRVADLVRPAPSHLLGPNGYAILLGHNGFIMHHPNYYALLEDPFDRHSKILKPYFSSVDLSHIEQVYVKNESIAKRLAEETKLLKLREAALNRSFGNETITVKRTIDCRRRPYVRTQTFLYGPIRDTPYAFMLALPESYGLNRMSAKLTLDKDSYAYFMLTDYDLWTVHPDYRYCEKVIAGAPFGSGAPLHLNDSLSTLISLLNATAYGTPYELEYEDLTTISATGNTNSKPNYSRQRFADAGADSQANSMPRYVCDKELFGSLLFDAKATYESFVSTSNGRAADDGSCAQTSEEMRTKLAQIYGLEMSFVATRSGLTRTLVFDESARIKMLAKMFIERHDRAVDEAWYQRTVDWNMRFNDEATIITAPYNAYIRLVAKLRQRITQRVPAAGGVAGELRTNCDMPPREEEGEGGAPDGASGEQQANSATLESSSSGVVEIVNSQQQALPMEPDRRMQADEPAASQTEPAGSGAGGAASATSGSGATEAGSGLAPEVPLEQEPQAPPVVKINYNEYSSFDLLDLLANSSVHIVATQSVVVNKARKQARTAAAVTGHLYDYAHFARKFLNATSLNIRALEEPNESAPPPPQPQPQPPAGPEQGNPSATPLRVDICPNGECATKCGLRNDTIDCLLVDNNGYIVVGEELAHIGRSLADYDDKLLMSLVAKRVFHQIIITDYQAICQAVPEAKANSSSGSGTQAAGSLAASAAQSSASSASLATSALRDPFKLSVAQSVLSNFASALIWTASQLYSALLLRSVAPEELLAGESLLARFHQWQRSAILAEAQSATANQSLLALLPNKTYLRPCEKPLVLYETRPSSDPNKLPYIDRPEFFVTRCGCSGWYVYDFVPRTNLLMLIVNTTSACRRCELPAVVSAATPAVSLSLAPALSDSLNSIPLPPNSPLQQNQPTWTGKSAAEQQVCSMLERDAQLYVQRPSACMSHHPEEVNIHICGSAQRPQILHSMLLGAVVLALAHWFALAAPSSGQKLFSTKVAC